MSDDKRPEVEVLGQPGQLRSDLSALAELLEQCGHAPQEAQTLAREAVRKQAALDPGVSFGHLHPETIADLWRGAARHGKRKLVLEITANALSQDEWDGHINVEVKGAQTWAEYEQAQTEARARSVN